LLRGFPEAQIVSFDGEKLAEVDYESTSPMQIVRHFLNHREDFLEELFQETPSLFEKQG
jgi:predicted ATPase